MANEKTALRPRRWARALFVVSLLGAAGCFVACSSSSKSDSEEPSGTPPAERVVALQLIGNDLSVVEAYAPGPDTPSNVQSKDGLQWTFTGKDGTVLAQGAVPDTRSAKSEFAEDGKPDPREMPLSWMVFTVRVPSVEGTFSLHSPTSTTGNLSTQSSGLISAILNMGRVAAGGGGSRDDATALSKQPSNAPSEGPKGIQKIRTATSDCAYTILMVPEAYSDMEAFHSRAAKLADDIVKSAEYSAYAGSFTFWTQDFVSKETTIGAWGSPRDTAFRTTYSDGDGRGIGVYNGLPANTVTALTNGVPYTKANIVLVVVNTEKYGGLKWQFRDGTANYTYITVTNNAASYRVVIHELGHAALDLADEYSDGTCDMSHAEAVNTSANLKNLPWKDLVTNPLPTPAGTSGVGAFEGAHYCQKGVYRPADKCLMRTLDQSFCPVCKRQLEAVFGAPSASPDGGAPDGGGASDGGGGLVNKPVGLLCRSKSAPLIK